MGHHSGCQYLKFLLFLPVLLLFFCISSPSINIIQLLFRSQEHLEHSSCSSPRQIKHSSVVTISQISEYIPSHIKAPLRFPIPQHYLNIARHCSILLLLTITPATTKSFEDPNPLKTTTMSSARAANTMKRKTFDFRKHLRQMQREYPRGNPFFRQHRPQHSLPTTQRSTGFDFKNHIRQMQQEYPRYNPSLRQEQPQHLLPTKRKTLFDFKRYIRQMQKKEYPRDNPYFRQDRPQYPLPSTQHTSTGTQSHANPVENHNSTSLGYIRLNASHASQQPTSSLSSSLLAQSIDTERISRRKRWVDAEMQHAMDTYPGYRLLNIVRSGMWIERTESNPNAARVQHFAWTPSEWRLRRYFELD